jgi:hypothetical protein
VFDGSERPPIKRRVNVAKKPHWMTIRLQQMLDLLGIQYYTASANRLVMTEGSQLITELDRR